MLAFLISNDVHDVEFFSAGASILGAICSAGFDLGVGFALGLSCFVGCAASNLAGSKPVKSSRVIVI